MFVEGGIQKVMGIMQPLVPVHISRLEVIENTVHCFAVTRAFPHTALNYNGNDKLYNLEQV